MTTASVRDLIDGNTIPEVGFGTYPLRGEEGVTAIRAALDVGYRLFDSAIRYENEDTVGLALRESGVDRSEWQVASKVPGRFQGYDETLGAVHQSLEALGLDQIDFYLIHWPLPKVDKYVDTYRALVTAREEGLIRSVGVSNFTIEHLSRVFDEVGEWPVVNQVELHPRFPQAELRAFHDEHGIVTESWAPLGRAREILDVDVIGDIAAAHGVTAAQVVLAWHRQIGAVALPKSGNPERIQQNFDSIDVELEEAELAMITALGHEDGRLWGADPDTHEEF